MRGRPQAAAWGLAALAGCFLGCSPDSSTGGSGGSSAGRTGGSGAGGATTGGSPSTGGTSGTGGVSATGGASASGGTPGAGGSPGGATGTGGTTATGGTAAGGATGHGGTPATGGSATGAGGRPGSGGTGGRDASGGALTGSGGVASGGTTTGGGGTTATGGGTGTGGRTTCTLPTRFKWTSSAALVSPPSGAVSIKDPSVAFFENKWHIFATAYTTGWTMVYLGFDDWANAGTATKTMMNTNSNLGGYKCAPQVFYFSPTETYYLVYQTQPPAYSTSKTPADVKSWSAMKQWWTTMPAIIGQSPTGGIDYWIICDEVNCHMFFSADNGGLYRAWTPKASFPSGLDGKNTVEVMKESTNALFEAANVYKLAGQDKYLLLVEAIGNGRYFRSWTADRLDGAWTPLAATEASPFAGKANVSGAGWASGGEISHGEMLRDNPDESMTIDPCDLKYLYQGLTKSASAYEENQYSLGVLTPNW